MYLVDICFMYDCRVEKKKQEKETTKDEMPKKNELSKKKPKVSSISMGPKLDMVNYKTMTGSTQYKFGVLAKIVKHMKARHQEGDDHPLTLEEILDETNQLDVGSKVNDDLYYMTQHNMTKHFFISIFFLYIIISLCE